jgi:fibronectin type 3 domain-containing protein
MNKYVFFTLLTVLMVSACTLEGDLETVRKNAKLGTEEDPYNPSSPYAPSAPSGVTAEWDEYYGAVLISWDWVSDVDRYYVYRSSSASGSYSKIGTAYSNYYEDTGLSANTTYYYKVSAYNNYGEGSKSSYVSVKTSSSSGSGTLTAPTGVTAEWDEYYGAVLISWNWVPDADGYYVYRSSSASGSYSKIGTTYSNYYEDTGLSANTTYYYKVSAWNSYGGESSQSSYASARIYY